MMTDDKDTNQSREQGGNESDKPDQSSQVVKPKREPLVDRIIVHSRDSDKAQNDSIEEEE